jgi:hypothetical protein
VSDPSRPKAAIPLPTVVRFGLWAGAVGLVFGAYVTYAYLQAA